MTAFRKLALLTMMTGCFSTPPNPPVDFRGITDGPDPCLLGGGLLVGGRTVSVGLPSEVNLTHAPFPENTSESFVFGHLFDALMRLDCNGRVRPGLARSWRTSNGGSRWVFEIDTTLTFWNGDIVTAPIMVAGLMLNQSGAGQGFGPALSGMSFNVIDPVTLEVLLPHAVSDPSLFADPVFALVRGGEGTGRYRLETDPDGQLRLQSRSDMLPSLTFRVNEDARDLVDARVDLLSTTDNAVARYAKSRRDFDAYPLTWSKRYVLLANDGFPELSGTPAFRERLALEAVRADARGAEGAGWWESLRFCPVSPIPLAVTSSGRRAPILYAEDDAVARDLAQRVAAVSRRSSSGLPLVELEEAIASGNATAVFPLPIEFPAPCLLSPGWLNALRTYRVDPLVDVRPHLVKAFLGPGAFAGYGGGFEFRLSRSARQR